MKLAITGVSGYLGRKAVISLERESAVARIVGLDVSAPGFFSPKLQFVPMDVRSPDMALLLKEAEIESVLHMAWIFNPIHNYRTMYDVNVNGSLNLMRACREASVKHIVILGSTTCYGAHADNPEWLTETSPLRANPDFPYAHHKVIVEKLCDDFERVNPDIVVTRLRGCIVLGNNVDNFIRSLIQMRGFRHAKVRGYNPAIQLLHEDDLANVVRLVLLSRPRGVYNVVPDDALSMHRIGEIAHNPFTEYPYWVIWPLATFLWSLRLAPAPASYLPFIMYPWAASNERIKRELGWQPSCSSQEALASVPGMETTHSRTRRE